MQKKVTQESSYLFVGNTDYIEALYEDFLNDPDSVSKEWGSYFKSLANGSVADISHAAIREHFLQWAKKPQTISKTADSSAVIKQAKVWQLIRAYRFHGHQQANLDPLSLTVPAKLPSLDLSHYGLSEEDLDEKFEAGPFFAGKPATLGDIQAALIKTYCAAIGFEYMYITDMEQVHWLRERIESVHASPAVSPAQQRHILERLTAAEGLEKYLGTKYVGQKRFSLEGADSLVPMLDLLMQRASSEHQVREVVLGMSHRGRLNVLVNVLGKAPGQLFDEFEGKSHSSHSGSGDVKYHLGFSSDIKTAAGSIHIALAFNPSHLEIVSPVVEGSVCARQT